MGVGAYTCARRPPQAERNLCSLGRFSFRTGGAPWFVLATQKVPRGGGETGSSRPSSRPRPRLGRQTSAGVSPCIPA